MEKATWVLETPKGEGVVVYFSNPITLGEAWSIWKQSKNYEDMK